MDSNLKGLESLLVLKNLLSQEEVVKYSIAAKSNKTRFIEYVVDNNLISENLVATTQANYFNVPMINLDKFNLFLGYTSPTSFAINNLNDRDFLANQNNHIYSISIDLIKKHNIFPMFYQSNILYVVTDDLTQSDLQKSIKLHSGYDVVLLIAEMNKLRKKVDEYITFTEHKFLEVLLKTPLGKSNLSKSSHLDFDESIINVVNLILVQAIKKSASDIHFEPCSIYFRIRFRIDGILHNIYQSDVSFEKKITSRIKVMANLDLAERRLAQDGRFSFTNSAGDDIDCRVSTCPTIYGEKLVIRILSYDAKVKLTFKSLQLNYRDERIFKQDILAPQGLILVTGPTGSGKSTTLYTALDYLNNEHKNIVTVEDPVEIKISGINQVQINSKIGFDFASSLRFLLRQDPDVIMVGEIRDLETAELAVKASQTGHLVLSTLHTNSTAETLNRLINIGIPVFNLISSLRIIVAQRLVRKLCMHCRIVRTDFPTHIFESLNYSLDSTMEFYKANGCVNCANGYSGRQAIFEVMPFTNNIINLISKVGFTIHELINVAESEGMQTLKQAGFELAKSGITTFEELSRVL